MNVGHLLENDIDQLIIFNKYVYPKRINNLEMINFWFSKNKKEFNLSTILKNDRDEILGQILSSSMTYCYKNFNYRGNWIFDYIVREDKRKDGYGIDLLQFALLYKKAPIFATGSGPMALKIELKMGFKFIGELKKYVGIINPIDLPFSLFRGIIAKKKFPLVIKTINATFKLISAEHLPDYIKPFNPGLIEFGRDKSFLNWRFFSDLHEYMFYKLEGAGDYFVVRTIVKKGITCLVLVDYRCNLSIQQDFSLILKGVKNLAAKLNLGIVITGSSIKLTDDILERKWFKSIGSPRPIISTERFLEEENRINNREFVLTTLADSDGEITW